MTEQLSREIEFIKEHWWDLCIALRDCTACPDDIHDECHEIREQIKSLLQQKPTESRIETKTSCQKCAYLYELYKGTKKTDREYWLMTELFVMLHGGDICKGEKE